MKFLLSLLLTLLISFPAVPQVKGSWRSVRTNNLFVIGNADAETLQQVATWLEFFHGAFARLVSRSALDASVPTTVIVFRDDESFTPFKPLYQGRPLNLAGYFQPGEDTNYIAIVLEPGGRLAYDTAFHEYVHLHMRDSLPGAPLWLNEGLAEIYGSLQFSRGEALLGAPIRYYAGLLQTQELLPLKTLFAVDTRSPHYNEQDKSGVFYAQSWALVHYLMLGTSGGQQHFRLLLQNLSNSDSSERAIERAFGTTIEALEKDFAAYVRRGEYPAHRVASAENPQAYAAYTATQRTSLSEGEANFYLGDLLLHIQRLEEAEAYFKRAIAAEPSFGPTYAALGQLYMRQKRYAEAKKYLERAAQTQQNYLVHYFYAYTLSLEGMSAGGEINNYSPEQVAAMREQLLRAIKLAPDFAPAPYLLAVVDWVADVNLDEAEAMARKARQLAPGRPSYALLLAHIHARRGNAAEARSIAEPFTRHSDSEVRAEAESIVASLSHSSSSSRGSSDSKITTNIRSTMAAESAEAGSSRMLVGVSGGTTAIRDGQTIETSESLPSLDEVLTRYVQAMGGAEAIKAPTSRVMKGTLDVVGMSRGGTFEIHAQAPNKLVTMMNAHPLGLLKVGYNGRVAWEQDGGRTRWVKGAELATLAREADFYLPLNLKQNFAKVTLLGKSSIGYREVYVLELVPRLPASRSPSGEKGPSARTSRGGASNSAASVRSGAASAGPAEKWYLDAQTYLLVRMNSVQHIGNIPVPLESYLDDWRVVDGIKYPFRISQSLNPGGGSRSLSLNLTVTEIKHGAAVDGKLFELPR